ncbi:PHD finger protein 24 isoform X2 [Takifugu rubripes]|uniref:PHD finger protein 24 isoform X2 n=1 Tax=Takifugu rubripes TaxID=31033 RepID=UPI00114579D4|nr:PHD finger protein 24 isoform X2 [Takifugu rubripes]
MGVLMSKKQQVEKVQKCNAVISAFQAGVRDRQAGTKQEEELEEETPARPSASPEEMISEEAKSEEPDHSSSLVPSQQMSVPTREESKVNQEAWSRLRDGKGVEPEELDKSHQLTPPAFVRPKREAGDDQPVEVELDKTEQPPSEEMCDVCEVWTADDLYPCRICTRVFHDGCLRELGYLRAEALQEMRDTAKTRTGWSCYYCDNLNLLLTEEEMYSLMETFKQCKIIPESCLVSDELLQYRHFVSKQQFDKDLTDEQEEEVLAQFAALDPDRKGQIEWSDFLYFESLAVLTKLRTENSLVRLLTAKERDTARTAFLNLDQDKDGLVTRAECRQAQQSWFHTLSKDSQCCNVSISHVGPIYESSPTSLGRDCIKPDESRFVLSLSLSQLSQIWM